MKLTVLYRGELSSCNYACNYCPFAKRRDSRAQLQRDRVELQKVCRLVTSSATATMARVVHATGVRL